MREPDAPAASSSSSSAGPGPSSLASPVASSSTSSPVRPSPALNGPGLAFSPSPRPLVHTRPKKGILKKPPPPPKSFFSLGTLSNSLPGSFSRFIPAQPVSGPASSTPVSASRNAGTPTLPGSPLLRSSADHNNALLPSAVPYDDDRVSVNEDSASITTRPDESSDAVPQPRAKSLRRAHFILPHLSTVYPISTASPPSSIEITTSRAEVEAREAAQREKEKEEGAGAWSLGRIEDFYRECCRLREEQVLGGVVGALRQANIIAPRTLDLTGVKLTVHAAAALSDALAIEWGLRKLILRECDLDGASLKHILHALLVPSSLASLSLSSNKRMKGGSFKLISAYLTSSDTLEFIDLSQNVMDKKSVELIVQAIQRVPPSSSFDGEPGSPYLSGFNHPGSPLMSPIYAAITSPTTYFPPLLSELANATPQSPTVEAGSSKVVVPGAKVKVPLLSLRLDECGIKGSALDALAHAIRPSVIQNLSFRGNKVGPPGGVALALMIRDYPDSIPAVQSPSASVTSFAGPGSAPGSPFNQQAFSSRPRAPSVQLTAPTAGSSLRSSLSALGSSINRPGSSSGATTPSTLPSPPATPPPRSLSLTIPERPVLPFAEPNTAPLPPPPRHPGGVNPKPPAPASNADGKPMVTTTYTPYIPRSKRNLMAAQAQANASPNPGGASPPIFQSSRAGGVTARVTSTPVAGGGGTGSRPGSSSGRMGLSERLAAAAANQGQVQGPGQKPGVLDSHSAALLDNIRSLDHLPRLGSLTTLDLRGNDLRNGVQYIAQVLKRNRTLRILSLADNKIEVPGFVQIAEALKYNSTLETLDMSQNPCCGPSLDGVNAIRTAVTINTALKRLYLSSTGLSTSGAIALAEFLPDARCLLHLDLTHNRLDLAAVAALSAGLKVNRVMRCLDVNVPPNDAEMARLSREILRCCVRNTEMVANPSKFAELPEGGMSSLTMSEDLDVLFGSAARGGVWGLIERSELARGVKQDVERERVGLERQAMKASDGKVKMEIWRKTPEEVVKIARDVLKEAQSPPEAVDSEMLLNRTQTLVGSVGEMVQIEKDPSRLEELLELSDRLNGLIKDLKSGRAPYGTDTVERPAALRRNSKGKEKAPESANLDLPPSSAFSIASDDDDEFRSPPQNPISLSPPTETLSLPSDNSPSVSGREAEDEEAAATSLSKSWVEEEGEVFRKGVVVLGPEGLGEDGADLNSEELKREILEAEVERKPRHEDAEDAIASA